MPVAADVTAVVLTFDEKLHIARCLERLVPHVARVVVVDSFSRDETVEIARAHGADVLQRRFVSHAGQFNWALDSAGITTGWTLRIDADEYLDDAAASWMKAFVADAPADVGAAAIRRGVVFQRRRIRHGGIGEVMLTRLWRTGQARLEPRWMDEHVIVRQGRIVLAPTGAIIDENLKDLGAFTAKHNDYATRQMVQHLLAERGEATAVEDSLNPHARGKRALRERLYVPAPLFLRALLYFLWRYILKGGWRDGREGFIFHGLQGLWNFMLVDVKLEEARRVIVSRGWEGFKGWLKATSGIDLDQALE
jgi:glycosyltransferase involved in cell wall biosynthesis